MTEYAKKELDKKNMKKWIKEWLNNNKPKQSHMPDPKDTSGQKININGA